MATQNFDRSVLCFVDRLILWSTASVGTAAITIAFILLPAVGCGVDRSVDDLPNGPDLPEESGGSAGIGPEERPPIESLQDAGSDPEERPEIDDNDDNMDAPDAATEPEDEQRPDIEDDEDPTAPDAAVVEDDEEDRPDITDDDEFVDHDGDGYSPYADVQADLDCDDSDANVHPGATFTGFDLDGNCYRLDDPAPNLVTIRLYGYAEGIQPALYSNTNTFIAAMTWNAADGYYGTQYLESPKRFLIKWPKAGFCSWEWTEGDGQTYCGETSFYDGYCHYNQDTVQVVHADGTRDNVTVEPLDGFTCRRVNLSI